MRRSTAVGSMTDSAETVVAVREVGDVPSERTGEESVGDSEESGRIANGSIGDGICSHDNELFEDLAESEAFGNQRGDHQDCPTENHVTIGIAAVGRALSFGDLSLTPKRARSSRNRSIPRALMNSLLPISDAPEYVKDNPNVLGGYRREMSVQQALQTMFMWHNETLNIWSHLLAALCFLAFAWAVIIMPPDSPVTANDILDSSTKWGWPPGLDDLNVPSENWPAPKWPLIIFDLGAAYCFTISALFHSVLCVSRKHYDTWRKMDFCAILVVMYSTFWPFCYYGFGCMDDGFNLFIIYVTVAAVVALGCLFLVLLPALQTNAFHALRPVVFSILGVWGIVPMIHLAVLKWDTGAVRAAVFLFVTQLGLHSVGAVFYATQWPERMRRKGTVEGKYRATDYFSSHFIFHVLAWLGLVAFHEGNMVLYRWRNSLGGCTSIGGMAQNLLSEGNYQVI